MLVQTVRRKFYWRAEYFFEGMAEYRGKYQLLKMIAKTSLNSSSYEISVFSTKFNF